MKDQHISEKNKLNFLGNKKFMSYYIGTDIGGTFTDCVVIDSDGKVQISKSPSTPGDFGEGLIQSLNLISETL